MSNIGLIVEKGEARVLLWETGNDAAPGRLWRGFCLRLQRQSQRRRLREMPEWQLRDIGITKAQARREAGRGFWDA